jgi:hypothetical protein
MIALSAVLAGLSLPAWAVTADELVAKNLEARGGAEKLRCDHLDAFAGQAAPGWRAGGEGRELSPWRPTRCRFELSLQA